MNSTTDKALFVRIDITGEALTDSEVAKRLKEVCPVDIFETDSVGHVEIVESNLDECVLCDLCVQAAPEGTVRVVKLYER